ncbi:nitroreductase family protein [Calycomorphotria hydatis]|uniref:Nitroreductase family protein n=1 Tax=Calycomorphotria hydatis TaxID=2528027 RepID=A0A517T3T5_9PLAN|nr:nitroreductase family protein [Calycomorphotria hydatis]QDT63032.1 Nitroreductase family protein [Calycomorphotria hydatis]
MTTPTPPEVIEQIIRARRTEKVLCDVEAAEPVPPEIAAKHRETVLAAIETAGWAPFHFPRKVNDIAEPWRAHVVWDGRAREAAKYLRDELEVTSKEPLLAAGCSALVLVTWLPEFYDAEVQAASTLSRDAQLMRDEEHLAAASAMVQNLLLLLTAHGMGTYWSSGGKFRSPEMFDHLGIPHHERLLAAVFIEYPEMKKDTKTRKPGALRQQRSDAWIREVASQTK